MTQPSKRRLGRGLAALIGDDLNEEPARGPVADQRALPIEFVIASRNNPRKDFNDDDLEDLARSIAQKGLLQPIVVRPAGDDRYEIVAGERRWRAAQRAGLHEVPAIIKELSDGEALEIALIENIQRSDLNPVEEARGYSQLMDEFGYTQQQLADSLGKSRSRIANTLRLLNLPDDVRQRIESGDLTAGHARALIATDAPAELAEQIVKLGLSVREAEILSRKRSHGRGGKQTDKGKKKKDADILALERTLGEATGLAVSIDERSKGGQVVITYKTLEQLDDICQRLIRKHG